MALALKKWRANRGTTPVGAAVTRCRPASVDRRLNPDRSTGPAADVENSRHRHIADDPADIAAGPFRSGSIDRPGYRGRCRARTEQGSGRRGRSADIAVRPDPAAVDSRSDNRGRRARSDPSHGRMAGDGRGRGIARFEARQVRTTATAFPGVMLNCMASAAAAMLTIMVFSDQTGSCRRFTTR